ncbi:DUF1642 domain-containing protein [Streptococcus dysgalactiae]|uniref:DUF1642 domain-containing protein n=1 Tax=Streptococcus dysgalactiae TaxID=1334 RepID=UPI0001AABBCD|nr:DUF1642 domain-containing protein [Streptococcus dysgalactiae]BAH82132.1 hypothetical protein SDEG_1638 [Streptococcus dysgalactiae subsp. equisimilis GGS_124]
MKIEEAIKHIEQMGEYERFVDEPISKVSVLSIIRQIKQPKPVVKQCVIDWVDYSRERHYDFDEWFDFDNQPMEVYKWLNPKNRKCADKNALALVTLIVNGPDAVTIEKEKLYTVEIPNPNTPAITILARSIVGDVVIYNEFDNCWEKNSRYQLTEQEIRKDFDWAWREGFAKEVTDL